MSHLVRFSNYGMLGSDTGMKYQMAGQRLHELREKHGLTLRDVETHSRQIAETRRNGEYFFSAGRLSQVENSNSLPSVYKLASLSEIYRVSYAELLRVYGIELSSETSPGQSSGDPKDKEKAKSPAPPEPNPLS